MTVETKEVINMGNRRITSIEGNTYFYPVVDGRAYSHFATETRDVALLLGLQIKYDGMNSQFCRNACRMLGIVSNWAD